MGRTIIVGDVHGCAAEFDDLLARARYAQGVDRLVLVGDLVARGPDSAGVIERALRYGAEAVRGNHDEKVLTWWRVARREGPAAAWEQVRLTPKHVSVVEALREEHFAALEALPLAIALPEHGARVVHAGIDPSRAPADAPEEVLLNVRSVDDAGATTRRLQGTPWAKLWRGPEHIVFGHDARRGLQLERHATGLDTGCCYGRALTALVLDPGQRIPARREARRRCLLAVPARGAWCAMGSGDGPE